ncbi:MAG: WGxxGxxG-CTERM domain-containing protein [Chthoniobacterales bacterium]|jgi:hypothetical protein|nr:WGxxGxxG-CTERM domain-containing protein [Chthoniobacterales bacterium]
MKTNIKLRMLATVCGALALSPLAGVAQTTPATSPGLSPSDTTMVDDRADRHEHHNYGWIGLAGLLGLAGLMGRKNDDRVNNSTTTRTDRRT